MLIYEIGNILKIQLMIQHPIPIMISILYHKFALLSLKLLIQFIHMRRRNQLIPHRLNKQSRTLNLINNLQTLPPINQHNPRNPNQKFRQQLQPNIINTSKSILQNHTPHLLLTLLLLI